MRTVTMPALLARLRLFPLASLQMPSTKSLFGPSVERLGHGFNSIYEASWSVAFHKHEEKGIAD